MNCIYIYKFLSKRRYSYIYNIDSYEKYSNYKTLLID